MKNRVFYFIWNSVFLLLLYILFYLCIICTYSTFLILKFLKYFFRDETSKKKICIEPTYFSYFSSHKKKSYFKCVKAGQIDFPHGAFDTKEFLLLLIIIFSILLLLFFGCCRWYCCWFVLLKISLFSLLF